jgi:AcrR family transcriptional regulator
LITDTDILSPEKQHQILRGAAAVFSQDGYEGASMSRIAACAGVSKGSLYNYFDSKAELFTAWVSQQCQSKLSHVFDVHEPDGQVAEALRGIGLRMLRTMMSNDGLTIFRLTMSEATKFPELARAFYDLGPSRAVKSMAAWLQRQNDAGYVAIPDCTFAAEQFFALCQTHIGMLRKLGLLTELDDATANRVVDSSVTMFLNTYGVKP